MIFCQKERNSTSEGMSIVTLHDRKVPVNINFQSLDEISFFWYVICLVPEMCNSFDLSHGLRFFMNSVDPFIHPFRCKHSNKRAVWKLRLNEGIQQSFPLKGWCEFRYSSKCIKFLISFFADIFQMTFEG